MFHILPLPLLWLFVFAIFVCVFIFALILSRCFFFVSFRFGFYFWASSYLVGWFFLSFICPLTIFLPLTFCNPSTRENESVCPSLLLLSFRHAFCLCLHLYLFTRACLSSSNCSLSRSRSPSRSVASLSRAQRKFGAFVIVSLFRWRRPAPPPLLSFPLPIGQLCSKLYKRVVSGERDKESGGSGARWLVRIVVVIASSFWLFHSAFPCLFFSASVSSHISPISPSAAMRFIKEICQREETIATITSEANKLVVRSPPFSVFSSQSRVLSF